MFLRIPSGTVGPPGPGSDPSQPGGRLSGGVRRGPAGLLRLDPHDRLLACVRMRIADRSVLQLLRLWLETPVVERDEDGTSQVSRPRQGTPQGGVISPLLANL